MSLTTATALVATLVIVVVQCYCRYCASYGDLGFEKGADRTDEGLVSSVTVKETTFACSVNDRSLRKIPRNETREGFHEKGYEGGIWPVDQQAYPALFISSSGFLTHTITISGFERLRMNSCVACKCLLSALIDRLHRAIVCNPPFASTSDQLRDLATVHMQKPIEATTVMFERALDHEISENPGQSTVYACVRNTVYRSLQYNCYNYIYF